MLAGTHRNSRGDNELYDLSIAYDENEKPVVKWTVTWIGGESHVFVADGTVVIPPVLYPRITPEKLVEWMMERLLLSSSVMKAIDRNAILLLQPMNGSCKEKMNVAIKKRTLRLYHFVSPFPNPKVRETA